MNVGNTFSSSNRETERNAGHSQGCEWYDPMDGGGRTASGTAVEGRVWNTTTWMLKVELRLDDCMEAGGSECREHILEQQPRDRAVAE